MTGDFLQIYAKPNKLNYPRLGLIVAKKMARRAVERNRVKRQLREYFRTNQYNQATLNMDWVIRLRCPIARSDMHRLTREAKILMLQLQKCHE
jgi:ribonuclease P protein component